MPDDRLEFPVPPGSLPLAPGLVALARTRLPQWTDRIEVGNAVDYRPAGGRRFTYVHMLLDFVPAVRRVEMLRHALATLVEPGGRLLVSHYQATGGTDASAAEHLRRMGFTVTGESSGPTNGRTAWLDA